MAGGKVTFDEAASVIDLIIVNGEIMLVNAVEVAIERGVAIENPVGPLPDIIEEVSTTSSSVSNSARRSSVMEETPSGRADQLRPAS